MRKMTPVAGNLSERKKQILRAIVEAHIAQGEPVGSKYLMNEGGIPFSSATIRNEMAELESLGYLEQPHTSSGRIPTALGYRFYVDYLMNRYKLSAMEVVELNKVLKNKIGELDSIIAGATKLVSTLTNYPALTMKASDNETTVEKFSYMTADDKSFLLVMRLPGGKIKAEQITPGIVFDEDSLKRLTVILNKHFTGIPAGAITLSLMMDAEREMGIGSSLISPAVKAVYETISSEDTGNVSFEGVNRLLEYPEFSDVGKIRRVMEMIDNKEGLVKIMSEADESDDDKIKIFIGTGDSGGLVDNSALIFKKLKVDGHTVGIIGVFGPARMDYSKVISTVEYLAENISSQYGDALPPGRSETDKTDKKDKTGEDKN